MVDFVDQSLGIVDRNVAVFDSLDACDRCRNIPWVDGSFDRWTTVKLSRESLSAICPICNILLSRECQILSIGTSYFGASLTWTLKAGLQVSSIFTPKSDNDVRSQILLLQAYRNKPLRDAVNLISITNISKGVARSSEYQYCDPPKVSFSQIKQHIDVCMEQHKNSCSFSPDRSLLDLQVIDCEQRVLVNARKDCKYVALSYVWGETSGSEDFVLSHSLPPTIEDTIFATLRLGYRYLWIDRYCIDQQDHRNRHRQISQMSGIYQRAQLTIIAAAGSNPLYGLPGVKEHRLLRPLISHAEVGNLCFSKVPTDTTLAEIFLADISESKWASRAWTYQEAVFSRRRLIFTDRQILFNCNATTCLESGIALPNRDLEFLGSLWDRPGFASLEYVGSSLYRDQSVLRLTSSMKHYCGRNLTKDSDALNAILSTLEELSGKECYHIWGVPVGPHIHEFPEPHVCICGSDPRSSESVDLWLSWYHPTRGSRRRPGFPSWSPLGWADAPIEWHEDIFLTEVVQVHTPAGLEPLSDHLLYYNKNPNEMPQLLHLCTRTAQGLVIGPDPEPFDKLAGSFLLSLGQGYHIQIRASWDLDSIIEYESLKIAIIDTGNNHIDLLLLKNVSDRYERIGYSGITRELLNPPLPLQDLWIQQDESSRTEYRRIVTFLDDDIGKADEKRLRASFGDLDNYKWWEGAFKEEYITLG